MRFNFLFHSGKIHRFLDNTKVSRNLQFDRINRLDKNIRTLFLNNFVQYPNQFLFQLLPIQSPIRTQPPIHTHPSINLNPRLTPPTLLLFLHALSIRLRLLILYFRRLEQRSLFRFGFVEIDCSGVQFATQFAQEVSLGQMAGYFGSVFFA